MKTIKLERPRERAADVLSAAVVLAVLLFSRAALNGAHTQAQPIALPTARPIIVIQTATAGPLPTPWPTAEPVVIEIVAPTPEPQVIYVQSPPEVVYVEAPEDAPAEPVPTLAPQQLVILDRQQWAEQAAER